MMLRRRRRRPLAAQDSAKKAAASAQTAQDAARRAEASAHDAERSTAWADRSARRAAASAVAAQADAKRAYDAKLAAAHDAAAARDAAHQAVEAANAKIKNEEAALEKMREQCRDYLKDGVPNGKEAYGKCLDLAAMSSQQRADLAAKNAGTCAKLFPNHDSKPFQNCLKNTLDPNFDSDQAMVVQQMHDANRDKWIGIGIAVLTARTSRTSPRCGRDARRRPGSGW